VVIKKTDCYSRSAEADRTIKFLIFPDYVNHTAVVQPATAGCAGRFDQFPQVSPGAMEGLIRGGGSNIE
jgi:hypothetical protein